MANNSSSPNELKLSVTAETSQAKKDFDTLRKGIEQLGKEFGRVKKNTESMQISEEISKSNNPLQKALSFLTKINKEVAKAEDKLGLAKVTGRGIENATKNLNELLQRQKNIYIGIRDSLKTGALHKQELQVNREITAEFRKQRRLKQDISGLKPANAQNIANFPSGNITATSLTPEQIWDIEYNKKLDDARQKLAAFELSLDPVKQKIVETQNALQAARDRFIEFDAMGYMPGVKNAEKDIRQLSKELERLQEKTRGASSWWGKLLGRIRNISIYRMIRSAMRWLTQGVSEGLNAFTQYSEGADKSLSNINNSINQVRNTLSITFAYVLQALEPIIVSLSDMIIDIINSINLALAKMRGDTYYDKVAKAADRMSQSTKKAQKFNFDAFNALSSDGKTDIKDLFYPEDIGKDENPVSRFFEQIFEIVQKLWKVIEKIIKVIKDSGFIESMTASTSVILDLINIIMDLIGPLVTEIGRMFTAIRQQINGVIQIISGLLKLLTGDFTDAWNIIGSGFADLCNGIVNMFVSLGGFVVKTLNTIFVKANPFSWILKAFGVDIGAKIDNWTEGWSSWRLNWQPIKGYATGGIPAKSEIFYMNENGRPEALVNTGGSQTNVINIAQLTEGIRQGFIQAIYDTGLNQGGGGQSVIQVDKDILGRTVAESSGFRNEVNRRNPALNLR